MLQVFFILAGAGLSLASALAAGRLIAPRIPLPVSVRLVSGAAVFAALVFALLMCHAGYPPVYIALGAGLIALARRNKTAIARHLPEMPWFYAAVLAGYGLLYLVFALAPEIQPDAAGYHLRLVSEYVRLHAFSNRAGFFDVLPQGMEMLFVPAFAIGAHSAAKMVHLVFLIATVPLIREISRELGIDNGKGCAAAAIFFLAPVCGVSGTSAYTDAGLACACCAVLYLLIRWSRQPMPGLLICAALCASFCYAVKPTFGWVAIAASVFIAARGRRLPPAAGFLCLFLLLISPWLLRAQYLSGSALAPFFSAWFPNTASTPDSDQRLAAAYSALRASFSWRTALPDYSVLGGNQGILGPAFLLLPLALCAWRGRSGRWLPAASMVLAVPILANTGTRFLMPAAAPASIAIASVLPVPVAAALVALQAMAAAPPMMDWYDKRHEWRLGHIPLRAALRLIPEQAYLEESIPDFAVLGMIARSTPGDARILAFTGLPESYLSRNVLIYWQSVQAQNFTDALHFAMMSRGTRARLLSWRWPEARYRTLRMTALSELRVVEASLPGGPSGMSSWKVYRPGDTLSFSCPRGVAGADLLIWPGDQASETTEALPAGGAWQAVDAAVRRNAIDIDVRRDATAYIRRSGYHYMLIPAANNPFAAIGADMVRDPAAWGVVARAQSGNNWLFYIPADLL